MNIFFEEYRLQRDWYEITEENIHNVIQLIKSFI